jgi:hypothetical protein
MRMTALAAITTIASLSACGAMPDEAGAGDQPFETAVSDLTQTQRADAINDKFVQNQALLGAPVGNTVQFSNGAKRDFANNASIYIGDSVGQAHIVLGLIRGDYFAVGAQSGVLGYPTTDELDTAFATGRFNLFEHGRSLWKGGAATAFSTHDKINAYFGSVGSEWGNLGYPQSDEKAFGSGRKNDFEFGKIYFKTGVARGVITAFNSGNKLAAQNWPRITSLSITPHAAGNGGCVIATGAGFPPGAVVSFRANDPGPIGQHNSRGNATVQSNGTFSFDENIQPFPQDCTPGILRVNGLATIEATVGGGTNAIAAVSTSAGIPWTGDI